MAKRGNPAFVKGCKPGPGRPKGSISLKTDLRVKVQRCANFMEEKGWAILERIAQEGNDKEAIQACTLIAAYGYGRPSEQVDVTSGGKAMTMAEFLTAKEGTSGDA